jgi:hypothetical protein
MREGSRSSSPLRQAQDRLDPLPVGGGKTKQVNCKLMDKPFQRGKNCKQSGVYTISK